MFNSFLENPSESSNLTEKISHVPILFADIAGFTKYSSSVTPLEVLTMLRELFTEFDKLCLNYEMYKLYTIGDCYVVMGVCDTNMRDELKEITNLLSMAFDMINIIRQVRARVGFLELDMRIGIHIVKI